MKPETYTPATVRRLRELAGKMPLPDIAQSLGWTIHRAQAVATAHGIDLAYRPMTTVTLNVPVSLVQAYAMRARKQESSVEAEMVATLLRNGR